MSYFRARKSKKLPRRARTIPLKGHPVRGNGEDHGKWFRCWVCGQRCNVDRDELGDSESRHGKGYEDTVISPHVTPQTGNSLDGGLYRLQGRTTKNIHVMVETDRNGDALKPNPHAISVKDSGTGCPFCHSLNWRGDYP
jgi:hypothetical protein